MRLARTAKAKSVTYVSEKRSTGKAKKETCTWKYPSGEEGGQLGAERRRPARARSSSSSGATRRRRCGKEVGREAESDQGRRRRREKAIKGRGSMRRPSWNRKAFHGREIQFASDNPPCLVTNKLSQASQKKKKKLSQGTRVENRDAYRQRPLVLVPPPPPPQGPTTASISIPILIPSPSAGRDNRRRRRHTPLRSSSSSSASEMEASAGTAVYPVHRCKTIYLVRHAQGIHNVEGEKDHSAYMSPALLDAQLTPLGWSQVDCLREHVTKCGLAKKIELVIVSPLLRTMQTAVGVFGGGSNTDGVSASPLMVEGAGHSGRQAISSLNCPPFLAVEACREHLGVHPCDKRSSITKYRTLFPAIDFSLIENDEDILWVPDVREANESVAARGMKFIDWLWTREEKEIAIVTHSGFLYHTLKKYGKECHPTVAEELGKHFNNCELRSMVLVDRSMLGSDTPTCNFPGKIPAGLDLPSDVADEKHVEEASKN